MGSIFFIGATNTTEPYEIVVALVIVIVSAFCLFVLYRNVVNHIRADKKERASMSKDEEKMQKSKKLFTLKTSDDSIKSKINEDILKNGKNNFRILYSINLDDFTSIKDELNEKSIDKIISELEKRLNKIAGDDHIAGHLHKDDFIFYYRGKVDNDVIEEYAQIILNEMTEELKVDNIKLTASVGVVVFPYDGIDADSLIKNADLAVYVAKKDGKATFRLYSEELIEKERLNLSYYQEIKKAIENEEFILYYQPIIDVNTGKIIGLESLLRWKHPKMGILPPSKFLNVMDLTGDITWFGIWGFDNVVKQYSEWLKKFRIRQLFISINLSPKQLYVEDIASKFYDITTKYGMKPDNFCLEIIDYFAINENKIVLSNLEEFRKYGFRIAIDDTGNNFELIDQMDTIPINMFKIPRVDLLKIMDEDYITQDMQRLVKVAKENHKTIIAEGIENTEMIKKMSDWGIRFMQGYYFSEPVELEKAKELAKNSPWDMKSFKEYLT